MKSSKTHIAISTVPKASPTFRPRRVFAAWRKNTRPANLIHTNPPQNDSPASVKQRFSAGTGQFQPKEDIRPAILSPMQR
jgi:hypothetical protein